MAFSFQRIDVVNLFAEDFGSTKSFYLEVLGLPLTFEDAHTAVFGLENLMVCLTDARDAPGLIEPRPVASPDAGSRCMLSMRVQDVDSVCAELAQRGVVLLNGPVDRPWGVRTANFTDPAGHVWQVGQDLG
jgi:predicted enzyme related to lactoylglutathione lyase